MLKNESKTMSTYERTLNRIKKLVRFYQKNLEIQKLNNKKANEFINKLRDDGRISKDEIGIYFKK